LLLDDVISIAALGANLVGYAGRFHHFPLTNATIRAAFAASAVQTELRRAGVLHVDAGSVTIRDERP